MTTNQTPEGVNTTSHEEHGIRQAGCSICFPNQTPDSALDAAVERVMQLHREAREAWTDWAIEHRRATVEDAKRAGDDVAAALSAAMDSGEPLDPESIDHCNYVIDKWIEATAALATPTETKPTEER